MTLNIPNSFTAGTKAKAEEVNENFAAVKVEVDSINSTISSHTTSINNLNTTVSNKENTISILPFSKGGLGFANISTMSLLIGGESQIGSIPVNSTNTRKFLKSVDSAISYDTITEPKYFVSTEQSTASANQTISVSHGLGAVPKFIRVVGVCKSAEHGHLVDDEVNIITSNASAYETSGLKANATAVSYNAGSFTYIPDFSNGGKCDINGSANWKIKFYAEV